MSGRHLEDVCIERAQSISGYENFSVGDTAPYDTMYDAVVDAYVDYGNLVAHEKVGETARAVIETCDEYDVPIDPQDVTVVGVADWSAPLACCPYGCGLTYETAGFGNPKWIVEGEPEGYVIFVEEGNDLTDHSWDEAVRHEIAHICGFADEGVTYEQRGNHREWCDRLDTW